MSTAPPLTSPPAADTIAANLDRVRAGIADACHRAHRNPAEVTLIAVSKVHPAEVILEAYAAGQRHFGENRVQEMQTKHDAVRDLAGAKFHLIGPLQNNKTGRAAELFHSVDTLAEEKTARRLAAAATALGRTLPVLVEVKLSHEEAKHGCAPADLPALLEIVSSLDGLSLSGLMTVPPWSEDPELARPYFQQLRALRDAHQAAFPSLQELSIGMSNDFAVAIEEGSTAVRIGTAIFGSRPRPPLTE